MQIACACASASIAAGSDMSHSWSSIVLVIACAMLPRIIGQGRAAELLFMGRSMGAEEAERWGFFNRLADPVEDAAAELAASLASGPTFAHSMTKTMLDQEWDMSLPAAIEAEAQAQAICMQTADFERAYHAFVRKERPVFEGD